MRGIYGKGENTQYKVNIKKNTVINHFLLHGGTIITNLRHNIFSAFKLLENKE